MVKRESLELRIVRLSCVFTCAHHIVHDGIQYTLKKCLCAKERKNLIMDNS